MGKHTDLRLHLMLAAILMLFAFCGGYDMAKNHFRDGNKMVSDTVIVERWDTVTVERPTEIVRYITRYDTVTSHDIVIITDTATNEPQAIIPIEQAVYSDSTANAHYTAFVSGFHAALDSITINCLNTETIITNTIKEKPRRIGVGVQLGVGANLQGLSPYVGIGVQYRLW